MQQTVLLNGIKTRTCYTACWLIQTVILCDYTFDIDIAINRNNSEHEVLNMMILTICPYSDARYLGPWPGEARLKFTGILTHCPVLGCDWSRGRRAALWLVACDVTAVTKHHMQPAHCTLYYVQGNVKYCRLTGAEACLILGNLASSNDTIDHWIQNWIKGKWVKLYPLQFHHCHQSRSLCVDLPDLGPAVAFLVYMSWMFDE